MANLEDQIRTGAICPYCLSKPAKAQSSDIYGPGHDYGTMYRCTSCDAYVGCHRGTDKPLGRLANGSLRYWKKQTHKHFDILWKTAVEAGREQREARPAAYRWLSGVMGLPPKYTHIGMFTVEECKRAIQACKPYSEKLLQKTSKNT